MKKPKPEKQPIPLSERPTLTVDEFCGLVGIGKSLFYKAVAAGDISARKYGKRTFVMQDEVRRFIENMPGATMPGKREPTRKWSGRRAAADVPA